MSKNFVIISCFRTWEKGKNIIPGTTMESPVPRLANGKADLTSGCYVRFNSSKMTKKIGDNKPFNKGEQYE